ncbi:hypothetical protein F4556_000063 [Kitasatospora gansuensis]|uniref:Uncharacterized protein n=1 Tax=Kitasatospora gansuensis TaxID=258050 RepID=A0A7W7S766_9ACTN|nr:hypothetical protein [Kitasatospora gansuensis]MBB4944528.1 hypothetical protein [Kitasatospora gansuensis]
MKSRTVFGAIALATAVPLFLAAPAQAAEAQPSQRIGGLLKPGADEDLAIANGGPVGPGLGKKSFADIMDLDAGILAIASGILNINGKEGIIASPGKLLGNQPPKSSKLVPAAEQDGVKFHNIDVVSFLPGVVDESWILAFGGKATHFGTDK